MRENDTPERSGDGSDAAPPVYPGESTDVGDSEHSGHGARAGEDEPHRTEAGGDSDTRYPATGTGSGADAGPGTTPGPEAGTGAEAARDRDGDTPAGPGERSARPEGDEGGAPERLLGSQDEEAFRSRWHEIQNRFVDDPRAAVNDADALVTDVIRKLAATFGDRRKELEGQWNEGEDVDTESLRHALRQYRSFFHRLLTT
ncbi:hypothetical protein [Streptomyces showdoensis]|uniref:hypothetical protein n=1 Tax=Streptomyces showdoensis TaxID=68268 RepID=UPI000F4FB9EF|nr:hypothetical protein [Streptomyces showdoensis]